VSWLVPLKKAGSGWAFVFQALQMTFIFEVILTILFGPTRNG
jgi:hypothetical protein